MAHEVESMAYAGQTPWHGLGVRVDELITIEDMLKAASLDWEVEQWPLVAELNGERIENTKRVALVRPTDKKVLTVTAPGWKPFQNRDALEFFREYCEAGGATLETAGSLKKGKIVWGLARLNKMFSVSTRDQVNGYVLLASPHEVGKAISVKVTSVRVVCANTMALALASGGEHRQSHWKDFDPALAKAELGIATEQFMQQESIARALAKLKIDVIKTVETLAPIFQPQPDDSELTQSAWVASLRSPTNQNDAMKAIMSAIDEAPGATPGSAWGVLSGVTYWADHVAGRTKAGRLNSTWFGANARAKIAVQNRLLQLAA